MTRLTIIAFLLMSGFFYVTGKPIDRNADQEFAAQLARAVEEVHSVAPAAAGQGTVPAILASTDAQLAPTAAIISKAAPLPDLPTRRPSRKAAPAVAMAAEVAKAEVKGAAAKTDDAGASEVVANGPTPLFKSMQERYAAPKPAVLGPRLTAVLIKRELRRVGCYDGNITGIWDDGARNAVELYNSQAASRVNAEAPDVATLEALQRLTKPVCTGASNTVVAAATAEGAAPVPRRAGESNINWKALGTSQTIAYQPPAYQPSSGASDAANDVRVAAAEDGEQQVQQTEVYRIAPARERRRHAARASKFKGFTIAQSYFKATKTVVRGWKSYAPRRRFGFSSHNGGFSLDY
jgi:hypothetical protein